MTLNEFTNTLNNSKDGIYIRELISEIDKMSPKHLEILAERYAPTYLCTSEPLQDFMFKPLTLIAKSLNAGRDEQFIDALSQTDYPNAVRLSEIRSIQDKYVIHTENNFDKRGLQNSTFAQTANLTIKNLPLQGWKFHISARNINDYYNLCKIAIPELDHLGVAFKMVKPEAFQHQMESEQIGKAITIYPSPAFDINKFSPQLKNMLLQDAPDHVIPNGDTQIQGRIFARYGRFRPARGFQYISSPNGQVQFDPKSQRLPKPDFISKSSPEDILSFYSYIENKFQQTGDTKTYMQEYFTMAECDGKSHAYITLTVDTNKAHLMQGIINNDDPYSLSFVANNPNNKNESFVFIHQTKVGDVKNIMEYAKNMYHIELRRPEWDIKENYYAIDPKQLEVAKQIVQGMAQIHGQDYIKLVKLKGTYAVKCDSVLDSAFTETAQRSNLAIRNIDPPAKSVLKNFYEKMTGKNINEKDITFEAPNVGNEER